MNRLYRRHRAIGAVGLISVFFVACRPGAWAAECKADKVRSVVGRPYSDELAEKARVDAKAETVVKETVGAVYTLQSITGRLIIRVDRSGIVVAAYCA